MTWQYVLVFDRGEDGTLWRNDAEVRAEEFLAGGVHLPVSHSWADLIAYAKKHVTTMLEGGYRQYGLDKMGVRLLTGKVRLVPGLRLSDDTGGRWLPAASKHYRDASYKALYLDEPRSGTSVRLGIALRFRQKRPDGKGTGRKTDGKAGQIVRSGRGGRRLRLLIEPAGQITDGIARPGTGGRNLSDENRKVKITWMSPWKLMPWERPRDRKNVATLVRRMKKEGWWDGLPPVFARDDDFEILDGHHRIEAALHAGLDRVPVVLVPGQKYDRLLDEGGYPRDLAIEELTDWEYPSSWGSQAKKAPAAQPAPPVVLQAVRLANEVHHKGAQRVNERRKTGFESGSERTVWPLGGEPFVVKVSNDKKGSRQNRVEALVWKYAPRELRSHLARVVAANPDGRWLVMEACEPLNSWGYEEDDVYGTRLPHLAGKYGLDDLFQDNQEDEELDPIHWSNLGLCKRGRLKVLDYGYVNLEHDYWWKRIPSAERLPDDRNRYARTG